MAGKRIVIDNGDFTLTMAAAAIMANVSEQTFMKWRNQPEPPPRLDDGSYSARAYGLWLSEHRGKKRAGRPSSPETVDVKNAETRLKVAQAEKVERENRVAEGELISVEDAMSTWQDILMRVRGRILKLPTSLAPILVGKDDVHEVQQILKETCHDALAEASEDWRDGDEKHE